MLDDLMRSLGSLLYEPPVPIRNVVEESIALSVRKGRRRRRWWIYQQVLMIGIPVGECCEAKQSYRA
jgi:hypothetical protein